jgi:hypothetical protein
LPAKRFGRLLQIILILRKNRGGWKWRAAINGKWSPFCPGEVPVRELVPLDLSLLGCFLLGID